MSKEFNNRGVYSLILTPFNEDRSINFNTYEKYVEWQARQGAQHLFACCGSSEMMELTLDEREKLAKKYEDEYAKKQEAIKKDYTLKLADIDSNIALSAEKFAKENGYNFVLTKNSVLFGGVDVTDEVAKMIK